jgi:phosphoglycerate dehydrogenase-like enzyme
MESASVGIIGAGRLGQAMARTALPARRSVQQVGSPLAGLNLIRL